VDALHRAGELYEQYDRNGHRAARVYDQLGQYYHSISIKDVKSNSSIMLQSMAMFEKSAELFEREHDGYVILISLQYTLKL
jgi:hypothetical protein